MDNQEIRSRISRVYSALEEKGYHPFHQICGYILTEDPTYITNHKDARTIISRIDRDALLRDMVKTYFE